MFPSKLVEIISYSRNTFEKTQVFLVHIQCLEKQPSASHRQTSLAASRSNGWCRGCCRRGPLMGTHVFFIFRGYNYLCGGFKYVLFSTRNLGKMIQFWRAYFSDGWEKTTQRVITIFVEGFKTFIFLWLFWGFQRLVVFCFLDGWMFVFISFLWIESYPWKLNFLLGWYWCLQDLLLMFHNKILYNIIHLGMSFLFFGLVLPVGPCQL